MMFDEALASRIRKPIEKKKGIVEKKMFDKNKSEEPLKKPHARPMDFTGKPMKNKKPIFIFVKKSQTFYP